MDCEIIIPLVIGLISGIISSLLFWLILNVWLIPEIETDKKIQYGKRNKYIRVYNKSHFNVFEVISFIEYKFINGASYYRTDKTIPYLIKKKGEYVVVLSGKSQIDKNSNNTTVEDFFNQKKGEIVITVTYQNRFGIKKTTKPISILYSNDEDL
jgi:hypothetical protein